MREPTFFVLTALLPGPLHGYGIIKAVEEMSDGRVTLRAGTLYAALERLEKAGAVTLDREETEGGPPRRYYRLTPEGIDLLAGRAAPARGQREARPRGPASGAHGMSAPRRTARAATMRTAAVPRRATDCCAAPGASSALATPSAGRRSSPPLAPGRGRPGRGRRGREPVRAGRARGQRARRLAPRRAPRRRCSPLLAALTPLALVLPFVAARARRPRRAPGRGRDALLAVPAGHRRPRRGPPRRAGC